MGIAAELIGPARRYRGVSGRALARAAQASAAALSEVERGEEDATASRVERLLTPLGYQVAVLPTRRGPAVAAAEEVRVFLSHGDDQGALRAVWQLADDLASVEPALRVALCVTPPAPTGDRRFDALLAGVVEHVLTSGQLPRPAWLAERWRRTPQSWDVEPVPELRAQARAVTPPALSERGVFLDPRELVNS